MATTGQPDDGSTSQREARRADDAWQAARRRVADRNDAARKRGQKERREHDNRIAAFRRAAGDGPPPRA